MKKINVKIKILLLIAIPYLLCSWADAKVRKIITLKEIVASTICAEAVGEGYVGMYAVANVIANRSRQWNKPPYEVASAKNQFYGYTSPDREELYLQGKEYCDYLEENILELDDITGGALYFRKVGEKKSSWHMVFTIKIGKHLFYK